MDILEEKENIRLEDKYKQTLKMAEEVREYVCERNSGCEPSQAECLAYNMQYVKKYVETLIAENKELKEEKEELKRENLEIRDWKYVIDSTIDLDKLKELDLIKIKGKEYISKSIYNELEKDKKALINNYSKVLGEFISKDKIKAKIEEVKDGTYDVKIVLQSLLGKE